MKIEECISDFVGVSIEILFSENEKEDFSVLINKKTSLSKPAIVCYVDINNILENPTVTKLHKVFFSENPSIDIEKDHKTFESFEKIILKIQDLEGISTNSMYLIDKIKNHFKYPIKI
jgi:hypothetical protein